MSTGHHEASWRLPESNPFAATDVNHYAELARTAERGTFDSLFLADSPQLNGDVGRRPLGVLEPLTLLTALVAVTERIGLIATASTSYNSPYNLARRFASLDHVSGGRAGWNIVTTATVDAARNFGLDELPDHTSRYARADEFVQVAQKLWDSWQDDAVVADKAAGVWGDRSKIHPPAHRGEHFSVEGPLNIHGPRRVIPYWSRPARPRTARHWQPATPRRCSPRNRPSRRRERSTPNSRLAPSPGVATRTRSRSCRASSRSSAATEAEAAAKRP